MNLSRTDGTDQYVRRKKLASCSGQSAFFLLLLGLILLFGVIGLKHGAVNCSLEELLAALFSSHGDETLQYFVRHLRLPRIISALAVGGVLAVNGVILQNVLNNPLASSFTLGLSQGAAFGASFALIALSGGSFMAAGAGMSLVTLCAFIGSTLSSLLIMSFTLIRGMTPQGLILAGVALATLLSAATMSLQYFATDTQVAASLFWTFGDLSKGTWTESIAVSAVLLCTLTLAFSLSLDYDALKWGDAQATGLGVDVKRVRFLSLLLTALSTRRGYGFLWSYRIRRPNRAPYDPAYFSPCRTWFFTPGGSNVWRVFYSCRGPFGPVDNLSTNFAYRHTVRFCRSSHVLIFVVQKDAQQCLKSKTSA